METVVFGITSINSTMFELVLETVSCCNVFVVTSRGAVKDLMNQHDIHCYLFNEPPVNISERDQQFANDFMPGLLGKETFKDSGLGLWEVLSLDRFKFWYSYTAHDIGVFLENMRWDKAYVSLDLGETLPWLVANESEERGVDCVGVRTESIRTKEFLDMSKYFTFTEYIVTSKGDGKFLKRLCPGTGVTIREENGEKVAEFQGKGLSRKGLGMQENEVVYGLFFDRRDEWQCRRWLSENIGKEYRVVVVPTDERSSELLPDVLYQYLPYVHAYHDTEIFSICEKVVAFRYDENYANLFKDKLIIVDYLNLNKSAELLE